ncbi:MAG: DUF2490 domain-containing protein [Pyrinomonadaceae bacterium]|nr:DUF2490 domain-containing protein [Pyrinomonadaceae bacterium]
MRKKILTVIVSIAMFSVIGYSQTNDHDTQIWNETTLVFPIYKAKDQNGKESEKLSGFVSGTLRLGQNARHFVDERIGIGLDYKVNNYLSFSPSYIYRAGQPTRNRKEFEHRLRFDLTVEKKFKYFSLKDRNRIEHRIRHFRDDTTRYRNKLTLKVPIKYKDGKDLFAPFVADEAYYDFRQDRWFRNEFSVGISRKLSGNTSADFYYMVQSNKAVTTLKDIDIFGISLKIKLK